LALPWSIGVLVLLFDVGLEADLPALVRVGPSAALVAVIGVVTPFFLGWGTMHWLVPDASTLAHLFVGATLTATSVGITARVLKYLDSLHSREGQVILGAAVPKDARSVDHVEGDTREASRHSGYNAPSLAPADTPGSHRVTWLTASLSSSTEREVCSRCSSCSSSV
jgi:hypothetical protein